MNVTNFVLNIENVESGDVMCIFEIPIEIVEKKYKENNKDMTIEKKYVKVIDGKFIEGKYREVIRDPDEDIYIDEYNVDDFMCNCRANIGKICTYEPI